MTYHLSGRYRPHFSERIRKCFMAAFAVFLSTSGAPILAHESEWAFPTFDASPLQHLEIEVLNRYSYEQRQVLGDDSIPVVTRELSSMVTPENALISRFSAVRSLDYEWWVQTWTPDAWVLAEQHYAQRSFDKEHWIKSWRESFRGKDLSLIHRIDFEDNVILTYMFSNSKNDPAALEYPIVFKKSNDGYGVSLDLRTHPLLIASPWVSGDQREVVEIE
jgi:hypothetical protein